MDERSSSGGIFAFMMTTYIALLRAVNVGGTGKLPMADLVGMCAALNFACVETYIASGNVVFKSDQSPDTARAMLADKLRRYAGKDILVVIRTAREMEAVPSNNPFRDREPRLTYAFFLNETPAANCLENLRGRDAEDLSLGRREIYVHYPQGMGQSKLQVPAARTGTARNLNTVENWLRSCVGNDPGPAAFPGRCLQANFFRLKKIR